MRKVLILLLTLPFTCICIAQNTHPNELHFNRLSIKNGLPADIITSTVQDKEGYIWIGTLRGLVRYDGYTTRVYNFGLEDHTRFNISSIYEDRSGELWVGTHDGGLYNYNRATDTFLHYEHNPKDTNSISAGTIISMHGDSKGNLWLILSDGFDDTGKHLNMFDTKKHQFKHYDILEKSGRYANAAGRINLLEDSKGHIWFGTNDGIYEYAPAGDKFILHFASAGAEQQKTLSWPSEDAAHPGIIWMNVRDTKSDKPEGLLRYNIANNTTKIYRHIPNDSTSLQTDSVYAIYKDSQGRLLFGAENGLSVLDPSSEGFINYIIKDKKIRPYDNQVLILAEDESGNFWCGNRFNLFLFDTKTKTFSHYTPNEKDPDALQAGSYNDLLSDRSGTLWVKTPFGLNWLNRKPSKFTVYKNNPDQPHYFPGGGGTSFAEEKDGTFWVWSSRGLYHWYPSSDYFAFIKSMTRQPEDSPFPFSSTLIDKNGIIWCSSGKGLYSYNPKTGQTKNFKNNEKDSTSLSSDQISTLYEDDKGTLWIGTMGNGLCSFNQQTGTFRRYPYIINQFNTPNNNALDDASVWSIYEDKQGTLWVGTIIGGLNRFNREPGTFTSYQNQSPGFVTITNIFEDSKGHLWVGTLLGGLFLFDRKTNTAKKFTEKDGLIYDGVNAINEDNANNLWITSVRGISILNIETNKISHLGTVNGLPEEPKFDLNFFKTRQGRFLMPCNNGFISFDPEQLKPDTTLPIVHIESVEFIKSQTRGNKQTDSVIYGYGKNKISLRYNENRITFNYVGLQYQNSALNQYAYKLEGYDKDWIQAGTQRKVTYTNLSPDTYTFHVKAANSDGVWSTQEQTLAVIIYPPWWYTWWAYLLYAIIFGGAVWAFIAYRSKRLKRENLLLEEKITLRTSQLNQSLEDLKSTQAQLIQSEKMASLGELTAGVAHEIQNPLNFVNNFSEVNSELIDELQTELKAGNSTEAFEISNDIKENEQKINHHGKRADAIVKGMLQHSRSTAGQKEPTDINALAEEYLKLSYHGMRAKDKLFNANMQKEFDEAIGKVTIVPQDIGRVLLNLCNNAFYAVKPPNPLKGEHYEPTVTVSTKKISSPFAGGIEAVEIRVRDNGVGIPKNIVDKIFQPFFTTRPTGQGTGLGLSLAYDIVTKEHGGQLKVETKEGEGAEFVIVLPVR